MIAVLLLGSLASPALAETSVAAPNAAAAERDPATAQVNEMALQPADFDLRLAGTATTTRGRLEIYEDDEWGTVCDDYFHVVDAVVACRQLGLPGGPRVLNITLAGSSTSPILMDDVGCSGLESKLHDCPHTDRNYQNCRHFEDVVIACDAPTHPMVGTVRITGRPELGETLTADTSTIADGDGPEPLPFTYQWLENGRSIPGRTASTLALTESEIGRPISVRVRYTDSGGESYTVVSPKTNRVAGLCYGWRPPRGHVAVCRGIVAEGARGEFSIALNDDDVASRAEYTHYETRDATATSPNDYASKSGYLEIRRGQSISQTVFVDVHTDGIDEPQEVFLVAMTGPAGSLPSPTYFNVFAITDGDSEPSLSVADASGPENGSVDFEIMLSMESGFTVSVDYTTGDATATEGSDYTGTSGTLTFARGETTKTIAVPTLYDALSEGDETFTFTLSNPTKAVIGDGDATGTIRDLPISTGVLLSAVPERVSEGAGATVVAVTATLNGAARTTATTVSVSVSGSGDANVVGFAAVPNFEVEIAVGAASGDATLTLTPVDDALDGPDETVTVSGTSDLEVSDATVTLADDDATSTEIALTAVPARVSEGAGATVVVVTAALNAGARTTATTVSVSVSGSGGANAVGFAAVADFKVEIAAGAASGDATFTLTPVDDALDGPDEIVSVSGAADLEVSAATVTLADDDATSTQIVLTAVPARVSEGAGATAVAVTAALNGGARTTTTTVSVSVSGSGGANAVGFATVRDFEVEIAAGAASGGATFTLTPVDDALDGPDEAVTVSGVADLMVAAATVTLVDDDATSTEIALTAVPERVSEGAGATAVVVTAALNAGARTTATTVSVSVSGSGDANVVGFAAMPDFEVEIAAGAVSGDATFTLTPVDDALDGPDETVTVSGAADLEVSDATVTLADDDATSTEIALTAVPARVSEGAGATAVAVTAAFNGGARTTATTVSVSVSGSGGANAVGFAAVPDFEVEIAAGAVSGDATLTLTPVDDALDGPDETVTVSGTSDLEVSDATVTLADDDATSTEIVLTAVPARVSEGAGATPVAVTAALNGGARTMATTVSVSVSGSGGANAVGFTAVRDFEVEIAAGAVSVDATFTLTPVDDALDGPDETVTVSGAADLEVSAATVTLADDDAPSTEILLAATPATVSEGAGATAVAVTATLDGGARTTETTVAVTATGSGGGNVVGFATVPGFQIVIGARASSGSTTFTLSPQDDNVASENETLTIAGMASLHVVDTVLTIADDDAASVRISLTVVPGLVSEGGGSTPVSLTASLNGAARTAATTVSVSVSGSGGANAVGFATVPDFEVEIAAGAVSGDATFTLTPVDDALDGPDETVTVSGAADLPVSDATLTLADDDATSTEVALTAVPARVSEGAGATAVAVTAALNGGARRAATTVSVAVSGSGGANVVRFATVPDFDVEIAAGAVSGDATFTLTPVDDALDGPDETLTVSGAADLPVADATVTLADDDAPSTQILLVATPATVSERAGATAVAVTAALNGGARAAATTVSVAVSGSGGANVVRFAAVPGFEVEIAAGAVSGDATFTLTPVDDALDGPDETLTVSGASDLPVADATVTLADDDAPSTQILLAATPATVSERAGATAVTVTAVLNGGARTAATTVSVSVSGSGGAHAVDFSPVRDFEIGIAAGTTSGDGTFTLVPENDDNVENNETVHVTGSSDLPVAPTTVTLLDDDEKPTRVLLFLSTDPAQASEGSGPVDVTVTARLDRGVRPQSTPVVISVQGSGEPQAVDFVPIPNFEVTVPANASGGTGSFTLEPVDDRVAEADEVLTVTGVAPLPVSPATVVLLDNEEAAFLLYPPSIKVVEGDSATYTVALAVEPSGRVTVIASAAGSDLDVTPAELVFSPRDWSSSQTVTVRAPRDADDEDGAANVAHRGSGGSYEHATAVLPVTVLDSDRREPEVQVFRVLLFESAAHPVRQGFLRIINHSSDSGEVQVVATDDSGDRREPVTLTIGSGQARHFNSDDLELGNPEKGLSRRPSAPLPEVSGA